jgi:hypothetical protein
MTLGISFPSWLNVFNRFTTFNLNLGDLVLAPGDSNPTAVPLLGGAKFLPYGEGANRWEFEAKGKADCTVPLSVALFGVAAFVAARLGNEVPLAEFLSLLAEKGAECFSQTINSPLAHFNFWAHMSDGAILLPACSTHSPGAPSARPSKTPNEVLSQIMQRPESACA